MTAMMMMLILDEKREENKGKKEIQKRDMLGRQLDKLKKEVKEKSAVEKNEKQKASESNKDVFSLLRSEAASTTAKNETCK